MVRVPGGTFLMGGADPEVGPAEGPGKVLRGGSYLCHDSYCKPLPGRRADDEHPGLGDRTHRVSLCGNTLSP